MFFYVAESGPGLLLFFLQIFNCFIISIFYVNSSAFPMTTIFYCTFKIHVLFNVGKSGFYCTIH